MLLTSVVVVAFVGPHLVAGQLTANSNNNPGMSQKIGVKITSPKPNQTIPTGETTIHGTSSDGPKTDCQCTRIGMTLNQCKMYLGRDREDQTTIQTGHLHIPKIITSYRKEQMN